MSHDHEDNNINDLDKSDASDFVTLDEYERPTDITRKRLFDSDNEQRKVKRLKEEKPEGNWRILDTPSGTLQ